MVRAMDLSSSHSPTPTKTTTTTTTTTTTPDTDSQTPPPPPPPPPLLLPHPIKSLSFTINGSLNRHQPPPTTTTQPIVVSYRECLKNHAASIGGHALDGCGEFMPSPSALPSDPTSLKCAACGCHRNFHRRHPDDPPKLPCHHITPASFHNNQHGQRHHLLLPSPPFLQPPRRNSSPSPSLSPGRSSSPGLTPSPTPSPHSPPPVSHLPPNSYLASPPQMLLALSSGLSRPSDYQFQNFDPTAPKSGTTENNGNNNNARKRFRTKFSQEQKEKMCLFAEKVGWKMQRSEEKVVEEFCNEVGVRRGVLKVWMHNNKHTLGKKSSINLRINNGINDDQDHNAAINHDTDHDQKDDQDQHRKANFNFFAYGSSSSS